jgi:predicted ATPase
VNEKTICPSCKAELASDDPTAPCPACSSRESPGDPALFGNADQSTIVIRPSTTVERKQIGSYLVERILGRGGMGVVYLALDPRLKRYVAIKALPRQFAESPEWHARLTREAELLGRLQHAHIAVIYERLDIEGEGSYLILEYVKGRSLRQVLREAPVGIENALRLSAQIATGLEAAHHRGIIHRDIKPENIQVTNDSWAKILDFGLAVLETAADGPGTGNSNRVSTGLRGAGTPGYMSPEQALGRSVDRRTDIFSFGCVLFETLTGQPAFDGNSQRMRIEATIEEEPNWSTLPGDTPREVCTLLQHCLEKNLVDRLRDIADARWSLESILGKRPERSPASAARTPHNLPTSLLSFVGREEAIKRLRHTLLECRLLTLVGAGGCGKTSLALKVAFSSLAEHPEGVWFVDLAATGDPARVPETILAAIRLASQEPGIKRASHEAVRSQIESIQAQIGSRKTLLILDNCEHLLAGVAPIVDALLRSCPQLRILATSRELIGLQAEQVYFTPSLSLPGDETGESPDEVLQSEAVRLFIERARLVRPAFEPRGAALAAIAAICQRLDGIPLAIELAASRIKMLSAQQILDRLGDRFEILTGGAATAPPRHRTLRAALDWSFRLLNEEDRMSLQCLEVFAGSWTLEAASAVLGSKESVALDLLTRLLDKSFIVSEASSERDTALADGRYRLHESIREYLRLQRTGDVSVSFSRMQTLRWEARLAHLQYFAALARTLAAELRKNSSISRQQVVKERDNFLSAQRFALESSHELDCSMSDDLREIWRRIFSAAPLEHRAQ